MSIFPGLYRGIVVDNDDSQLEEPHRFLGRLKIKVPQVYGEIEDADLPWAWPCFNWSGREEKESPTDYTQSSMQYWELFGLPKIGEEVWVAFECGNPRSPVWLGVCYGETTDPVPELDGEAREDKEDAGTERTDTKYPDIYIMRAGNAWLRIVGDKRIEMVFDKNRAFFEFDAAAQPPRALLRVPNGWAVNIEGGVIELTAVSLNLNAANVNVNCRNFNVNADAKITQQAKEQILLESPTGELYGRAARVSGFETHQ